MKKRLMALVLALLMLVMTACGKDSDPEKPSSQQEQSQEAAKPEFAYQASYFPIDTGDAQLQYINSVCLSGGKLYFMGSCQTGMEENKDEITGEPYLDENGAPTMIPVYQNCLFAMDLETQAVTMQEMNTFEPAEGTFGDSYFGTMSADGQGGFWITETTNSYHFEFPEDFDPSSGDRYQYYVDDGSRLMCHHFDAQGQQDKTLTLETPEGAYLGEVTFLPDGSMYSTDWMNVYRFDENGKVAGSLSVETGINMLFPYSDTQMGVSTWTESGNVLQPIDPAAMTLGEGIPMPANAYRLFQGFGDYDYLYYNNDIVYGVKAGEETGEKILSWLEADVDSSNLSNYCFLDDGTCYAMENQYNEETGTTTYRLVRMDRVDASTIPEKQELRLACLGLDWDVRTEILEFNRASTDVRIVVDDYSQYATDEDYYVGLTKLNTEILSGKVPDLFLLNEQMPLETYAAKGIVQDLWPLIDSDPELSREDLMTHFFDVLSIDGKLYQVVDSFIINTVVGRSDVIGNAGSWTLDELMSVRQDYPDASIFGETDTREGMMYNAVLNNVERFVDWGTKQCSFNTETFEGLLELAAEFPAEFDYENFDWNAYGSEGLRMRMRRQLLCQAHISSFDMLQYYNAMCEGKASFIGYPTSDGTGSTFTVYGGLAISSGCQNTEAAWKFVRTFLTEEFQTQEYMYQFPTNRHSFEACKQQFMTPRWFDIDPETGEEVEQPSNWYYFEEGDEVEIYTLTEAEYELFMDLYERTNALSGANEDIAAIITEECEPFFAGEKSAKDTASLIQDRVSLYVFEQG